MTAKKKAAVCVMCLLLAATMILSACGPAEESTPAVSSTSVDETSEETSRYVADVEVVDYDGATLTFLIRDEEHGSFATWDFQSEDTNSEVINDALDARNYYIEDRFNCHLAAFKVGGERNYGTMYQKITLEDVAQTGEFDVAYSAVYDMVALSQNGMLYDLSEIGTIDLTKPWWNSVAMKDIAVASRLFGAVGDISVQITETCPAILFNKSMLTSAGLENPYTLVSENKWTFDKMAEMSKAVYRDTDSSYTVTIYDTFGNGGQFDTMYSYMFGMGLRFATLDESGEPVLTLNTEENINIIQKVFDFVTDQETFMSANDYFGVPGFKSSPSEYVVNAFSEERMLFYSEGLLHVPELRSSDVDFGLLPTPKYNEDQTESASLVGIWGATALVIPLSCQRVDMTCTIVEALAAESKNTLSVAYYEKMLAKRDTRDDESEATLKVIIDSIRFDVGRLYNWGTMNEIFSTMQAQKKMEFASLFDARREKIRNEMEATYETFSNLPHYIETEE